MAVQLDHELNAYFTVLVSPASPYQADPNRFSTLYPGLDHVGPLDALPDVHVVRVPRSIWEESKTEILNALRSAEGVLKVDVQEQRQRAKRDEF